MALGTRSLIALPCLVASLCFFSLQLTAAGARGQADDADPDPLALQIHGFASQGFFITTNNDYLAESKDGSFELTEVGVNLTKPLTQELRFGVQLFARDLGRLGNYSVKADWFYLDYRYRDWLGFRAGRVKLPFGLYNEVNDIDSARVPILLPGSVYPVDQRDYLLAQTGFEVYGYLKLDRAGALDYRLYGGTIFIPNENIGGSPAFSLANLNVPYVVGGRLLYETPLPGLRAGGSVQAVRLDLALDVNPQLVMKEQAEGDLPASFRGRVNAKLPVVLCIASIEYAAYDLQATVEYSRWYVSVESDVPVLVPERDTINERMYGLISYRFTGWFQPAFYYAQHYPDVSERDGRAAKQRDWALTLRFDINEYWLIKLEGHLMDGTAALDSRLNDGVAKNKLERRWTLFLAKTTAYF